MISPDISSTLSTWFSQAMSVKLSFWHNITHHININTDRMFKEYSACYKYIICICFSPISKWCKKSLKLCNTMWFTELCQSETDALSQSECRITVHNQQCKPWSGRKKAIGYILQSYNTLNHCFVQPILWQVDDRQRQVKVISQLHIYIFLPNTNFVEIFLQNLNIIQVCLFAKNSLTDYSVLSCNCYPFFK